MKYNVKLNKRDLKGRGTCQEEYNSEKIEVHTKQYRDLRSLVKITHVFISFKLTIELSGYQACMVITNVYVEHVENIAMKLLQLSQLV